MLFLWSKTRLLQWQGFPSILAQSVVHSASREYKYILQEIQQFISVAQIAFRGHVYMRLNACWHCSLIRNEIYSLISVIPPWTASLLWWTVWLPVLSFSIISHESHNEEFAAAGGSDSNTDRSAGLSVLLPCFTNKIRGAGGATGSSQSLLTFLVTLIHCMQQLQHFSCRW